jgi:mannitol 2-dehydrogenase
VQAVSDNQPVLTLSNDSVSAVAARGIPVPTFDRTTLKPRILHVGVGGFHRAHLALYTHELAERGSTWGIRGLGLLAHDAKIATVLATQNHLYSLTEKGTGTFDPRIIGSIIDYQLAADDSHIALTAIADPITVILSLTITEAGYVEPAAGHRTTFDVVADGLARRQAEGSGPITILSCDNLPGNGDVARTAMMAAAARHSAGLVEWITANCSFPNSMVDRITPQTAPADRAWLLDNYGVDDQWPVVGEPFRQWVIEDDFIAGRPAWEEVGVLFTDDVHRWELYKLRMLNAGHSCMAYLSALAGVVYVDEAMTMAPITDYLHELLYTEALPTLVEIPGHPREDYIATVLGRFANTGVRDQIARLCIDGTAKFPTFLIPTIERELELGGPIRCTTLALAAWARYLGTVPLEDQSFDTHGDATRPFAVRALDDPAAFLELTSVFPETLRSSERFCEAFVNAYRDLEARGPIDAMIG